MWNIPNHIVESHDNAQALHWVLDQLKDPEDFLNKVKSLYSQSEEKGYDAIEFKDGKIFERYSRPQMLDGKVAGRVWSFRDETSRHRAQEALRKSEERYRNNSREYRRRLLRTRLTSPAISSSLTMPFA